MCLLTNERYKIYQMRFSFDRLGHALGVGLGGTVGVGGQFSPEIQTDSVSYLIHEWHMQRRNFWVPAPWGIGKGPKGQIPLNLNINKVIFKDSKLKLCVFSQSKDIKHIRRDFHSVPCVMP